MLACSLLWPNGSICQATLGLPHSPKVSVKNLNYGVFISAASISFSYVPDSHGHIVNDSSVVSSSLIIHTPSSAYKLQSSFIDKILNNVLHGVGLLSPPPPEESRLNIDEPSLFIKQQGLARKKEYIWNICDSPSKTWMTLSRMYWTPALWMSFLLP